MSSHPDIEFLSLKPMVGHGTTELRCRQPAEWLEETGWRTSTSFIERTFPTARRALVLHRVNQSNSALVWNVIRLARARGLRLIYDTDDLVSDGDPDRFRPSVEAAMKAADLVTVSTTYLKAVADRFHPDCRVVRNGLSQRFVELARQPGRRSADRVTIGYFSGSPTHDADFALIAAQLAELARVRPQVRIVVAGKISVSPELEALGERFRFEPFRPYYEFVSLLAETDINLAPLDLASPFACARSELKCIEAAAFAVPTVASPSPAYAETIEHNVTGLLCGPGEWLSALTALVDDPGRRREMGLAARNAVLARHGPDRCRRIWDELMHDLLDRPPPPRSGLPVRAWRSAMVAQSLARHAVRRSIRRTARRYREAAR